MRKFIFADEAGDFNFSRHHSASRFFIVCAVRMNCDIGLDLLKLRRELLWDAAPIGDGFHATTDKQIVRDRVYDLISSQDIDIFAQVLEKSKAQPHIAATKHRFYKHAWYYLFKHAMGQIITSLDDQLMVTTASIGVKKGQVDFSAAVLGVLKQTQRVDAGSWRTNFCAAAADPCLQIADYCTWAIQRRWERNDRRSYDLIRPRIRHEYDMWQNGTTHYY
ncbi:MAG: DUF3800 domain-containing protein [Alphaproteobacteria bacterium]|nr:DUF3800 domain-containing protein [Alphaproteobacteria bacterium]